MASITFYGGTNTIGGNMFLVKSRNTRIFLDFGKNFSAERDFFEFPVLRPSNIHDLLKLELLPDLKGLYRFDGSPSLIKGVFLTHAHIDHYGYIPCLRKDTNIFLGACTKRLIDLRSDMHLSTWDTKQEHLKFTLFKTTDEISITDDFVMRPIHVDHSVPGAYGFVIHVENKTLVYTGDLRFHGYASPLTADFLDRVAKEDVDLFLCEGTNVQPTTQTSHDEAGRSQTNEPSEDRIALEKLETEKEVLDKLVLISDNTEGLVLYDMTLADIDRLRTVWQAAEKTGRRVLYDSRQAYLLLFLNAERKFISNLPEKGDFDIYLDRLKKRGEEQYIECFRTGRRLHEKILLENLGRDDLFIWGSEGRQRILANGSSFLLCTSNGISQLLQFKEKQRDINGVFVYGRSEPYNEEAELTFRKLKNWIRICNMNFDSAHTSGHASQENIASMIEILDPAITIPVHTEHPGQFTGFTKRLHLPLYGDTYTF